MLITTVPFLGHTTTSKELFFKLLLICIHNQSIISANYTISHTMISHLNDFTPQWFHTSTISHLNDFTPKVESPTQRFHTYGWVSGITRIDQAFTQLSLLSFSHSIRCTQIRVHHTPLCNDNTHLACHADMTCICQPTLVHICHIASETVRWYRLKHEMQCGSSS